MVAKCGAMLSIVKRFVGGYSHVDCSYEQAREIREIGAVPWCIADVEPEKSLLMMKRVGGSWTGAMIRLMPWSPARLCL